MAIPTALAPTVELATPRVRKFVDGILDIFGPNALIADFFTCDPSVLEISSGTDRWYEGNWGVNILADRFSMNDLDEIDRKSKTVQVGEAVVYSKDSKLQIRLWPLCAGVA